MKLQSYGLKRKIKMFFIDTNIFLEVELMNKRLEECKEFLRKIYRKEINALTSDFVVYSCLIQLQNRTRSTERMREFMLFLANMENLDVRIPSPHAISNAFDFMERYKLDFDDALVVSTMKSLGIEKLVSFDKDFDKVKEIQRVEPQNAF